MKRAIEKYGWQNFTKEILLQTTDQEIAFQKEIDTIAELDLQNPDKGYNLDRGGRPHGSGDHLTPEGRRKISEAIKKKWKNPEFRAYMSALGKQHPPSRACIEAGVKASAAARKGKLPHNALAVEQLDKDTNEVIASYPSATHAAKAIAGEDSGCANILAVCKKRRNTAYGYKWRFQEK